MKKEYFDFPDLSNIYLEDSYLLGVNENGSDFIMDVDLVLTEEHKLYSEPLPSEAYCYKKGKIFISNILKILWVHKGMKLIHNDLDTEPDYGNIDYFYYENGEYHIGGEWGDVIIQSSDVPKLEFVQV